MAAPGKPVSIMFYNFKGGSAKTTTSFHAGCMLAKQKHNVLMVDADMQCSLTDLFSENLNEQQDAEAKKRRADREKKQKQQRQKQPVYETDDTDEDEPVSDTDSDCEPSTAPEVVPRADPDEADKSAAEVLFALHRQSADLPAIQTDKLADDLSVMYAEHIFQRHRQQPTTLYDALLKHSGGVSDYLPPVSEVQGTEGYEGKMYLLAGDERMSEWAGQVRTCYIQGSEGGLAQTAPAVLGAFRRIIQGLAALHEVEYILIDAGPSSDEVNKILATSCDYIQPTVMLDFFNWTSVRGLLQSVIPSWFSWQKKTFRALSKLGDPTINELPPYILPFLGCNYPMYKNEVRWGESNFVSSMRELFQIPEITRHKRVMRQCLVDSGGEHAIPFLKQLKFMTTAQELGLPVFDLNRQELEEWLGRDEDGLTEEETRQYVGLRSEAVYAGRRFKQYCHTLEYYWNVRNGRSTAEFGKKKRAAAEKQTKNKKAKTMGKTKAEVKKKH